MVLVPKFEVQQDDEFVIVDIWLPDIRAHPSSMDFFIGGRFFKFSAPPYLLRLRFPYEIVENGRQRAEYDVSTCRLRVYLPKAVGGQVFPDLDLPGALLAPSSEKSNVPGPRVQELSPPPPPPSSSSSSTTVTETGTGTAEPGVAQASKMDYAAEQDLLRRLMSGEELRPEELAAPRPRQATEARYYGFNQGYSGYLLRLQEPLREVVELPDPEFTPAEARRAVREALEEAKFDPEHYMHDFADPEREIEALLQLEPHWLPTGEREFSEDELTTLRWLPARSYALMSGEAARRATLGLLELVFAYAHEWRLQHGEPGVESAVSLCRLSAQLSCLDESQLESPRELVRTCMRRALAYPLYRHWGLACRALEDARLLLARGRRALLRALLQIKHALEFSQAGVRHLVPLYLEDYCVWLQAGCTDAMLDWLQAELARPQNQPDKQAVGWPLERLERQVIEDLTRDDLEEESLLEEESAAPLPL